MHKTIADIGGIERFGNHFVDMDPNSVADGFEDPGHIVWLVEDQGEFARANNFGKLSDETVIFDNRAAAEHHCHFGFFDEDEGEEDNDYHALYRHVEAYCFSPIPGAVKPWSQQQFEAHVRGLRELAAV